MAFIENMAVYEETLRYRERIYRRVSHYEFTNFKCFAFVYQIQIFFSEQGLDIGNMVTKHI